jgi:hypothetical protein
MKVEKLSAGAYEATLNNGVVFSIHRDPDLYGPDKWLALGQDRARDTVYDPMPTLTRVLDNLRKVEDNPASDFY